MKKYVKVALYAYPILKKIGEEYQIHISNRALLSYKSGKTTEELAEYLAKEIICKQRLEWLKGFIDERLEGLDEIEKALLYLRYFSPSKSRRDLTRLQENAQALEKIDAWSDSTYFRRQAKLADKVERAFMQGGLIEEIFERDFSWIDILQGVARFVDRGGEKRLRRKERERS